MISTVILYKNEQESLLRCLDSLSWCKDVVVVVDSHDGASIPKVSHSGVTITQRLLQSDFSAQRTYGMEQAKSDWVFFIDADEQMSRELQETMSHLVPEEALSAYTICRTDVFWGKKLHFGEVGDSLHNGILRLVNRKKGSWKGVVHEIFQPIAPVGKLRGMLLHYPHQTLSEFIHHVNFYSSLRAQEIKDRPTWRLFIELIAYPPAKFFYTYVVKLGLLDGPAGFTYSFMMSFHSFLVRAKAITKTW